MMSRNPVGIIGIIVEISETQLKLTEPLLKLAEALPESSRSTRMSLSWLPDWTTLASEDNTGFSILLI
jgi:hypothetical protein